MSFVTHLECSLTGDHYPAHTVQNLSAAGKPLLVNYDLDAVKNSVTPADLADRRNGFWKYRELLPMREPDKVPDLGETVTPIIAVDTDDTTLLIKDEGRLPTGSFKARGLGVAVAMATELGLDHLAMPTNGNAGAALAAYCARAGLKATVFCPSDTPSINIEETRLFGAEVNLIDGLINDCGKLVAEGKAEHGWFELSTLKEPYRIEGKKTMGLELAEQLGWELPDAIFYPTGGGTGLIGMWKVFDELEQLGWIGSKRPRMYAVQAEGCAPIVRAYEEGKEFADTWEDATTVAAGIRVPAAVGDFLILRAVRASGGSALAVSDHSIMEAQSHVASNHGVLLCPEGAATWAAWQRAKNDGQVSASDRCVLFNCATGLKYF